MTNEEKARVAYTAAQENIKEMIIKIEVDLTYHSGVAEKETRAIWDYTGTLNKVYANLVDIHKLIA